MPETAWPESRVRAAYAEWRELNDRAVSVRHSMDEAKGHRSGNYGDLILPEWRGTRFPGEDARIQDWNDEDDHVSRFPLEWLWTYPECVKQAQTERLAWKQTREAEEQERAERETLARLKSKYEGE